MLVSQWRGRGRGGARGTTSREQLQQSRDNVGESSRVQNARYGSAHSPRGDSTMRGRGRCVEFRSCYTVSSIVRAANIDGIGTSSTVHDPSPDAPSTAFIQSESGLIVSSKTHTVDPSSKGHTVNLSFQVPLDDNMDAEIPMELETTQFAQD